jgi:hypothetical protein
MEAIVGAWSLRRLTTIVWRARVELAIAATVGRWRTTHRTGLTVRDEGPRGSSPGVGFAQLCGYARSPPRCGGLDCTASSADRVLQPLAFRGKKEHAEAESFGLTKLFACYGRAADSPRMGSRTTHRSRLLDLASITAPDGVPPFR